MGDRALSLRRVGLAAMAVALVLPIVTIERVGGVRVTVYGGEWLATALASGLYAIGDDLGSLVGILPDRSPYDDVDLLGAAWFLASALVGVAAVLRGRAAMPTVAIGVLAASLASVWFVSLFASARTPCPFVLRPWGPSLAERYADWAFAPGHWTWLFGATLVLVGAMAQALAAARARRRWTQRPWGPPQRPAHSVVAALSPALRNLHAQAQHIREELAAGPHVSTPTADLLWGLAGDLVALDLADVRRLEECGVTTQRLRAELLGEVTSDADGRTAIAEALRCDAALERLCTRMTTQFERRSPFRATRTQ